MSEINDRFVVEDAGMPHHAGALDLDILQKAILDSANLAIIATDANGVFPLTIET
jgi:hypothetical protein